MPRCSYLAAGRPRLYQATQTLSVSLHVEPCYLPVHLLLLAIRVFLNL